MPHQSFVAAAAMGYATVPDRDIAAIKAKTGAAAYEIAYTAGQLLTLHQAVALASGEKQQGLVFIQIDFVFQVCFYTCTNTCQARYKSGM
jgi:hypothetical protein